MDKKHLVNVTYYDFLKLLWAVLLFFLALVIWVKEWWEPFTMLDTDYYQQEEQQDIINSWDEHGAARTISEKLASICALHEDWCRKIVRSWNLSDYDKIGYVSQYFVIFDFLDRSLVEWWDIKKEFKTLVINSNAGKRRWWATWSKITINLDSFTDLSQFWQVLTHEFWHIVDLWVLNWNSWSKDSDYTEFWKVKFSVDDPSLEYYKYSWSSEDIRKSSAVEKDFCSDYWMSNPFEDFAECHNLYLNNRKLFRSMAAESSILKNKFNFFANLFDNEILWDYNSQHLYVWWRPWDTTAL